MIIGERLSLTTRPSQSPLAEKTLPGPRHSISQGELGAQLFAAVPREEMAACVEQMGEWITGKRSDRFYGIIRRHGLLREFARAGGGDDHQATEAGCGKRVRNSFRYLRRARVGIWFWPYSIFRTVEYFELAIVDNSSDAERLPTVLVVGVDMDGPLGSVEALTAKRLANLKAYVDRAAETACAHRWTPIQAASSGSEVTRSGP